MKKLLVLLLGFMCIFVVAGCGKSDGIEGTWVLKMSDKIGINSIELVKENDFYYKGTVKYKSGAQFTSSFVYQKENNSISEDKLDAEKHAKEMKIHGRISLKFNDDYTEAIIGAVSKPEYIFVKQ